MFAQLSLKSRLWLLGIAGALGIVVLVLTSIWHAYYSKQILLGFVDQKLAVSRSASMAYAQGLQMGQALRNILLDPANRKAYDNFTAADEAFRRESDQLVQLLGNDPGGSETVARVRRNVQQWRPLQQQTLELIGANNSAEARTLLVAKETPAWRAVRDDLLGLIKHAEEDAAQDRARLLDGFDRSRDFAIALGLISLAVSAAITVIVARGIFRQVGGEPAATADLLHGIAAGDLTRRFAVRAGDSASIAAAADRMQAQIHELIGATVASADAVVAESEAMHADAARLAETAEQQSAASSAIAAAVQEMTVSIAAMSESAVDAGHLSEDSEKRGHESLAVVSSATDTIRRVTEGMSGAAVAMEELSRNVGSIDGIVRTIREIADQTNLLALNAAIEAARAGEQGRGFAVVADEVRKLAERTTNSTQEVAQIVDGIRATTASALQTMDSAKTLALEGASHTEAVRAAVARMDQASADVSKAIESIAAALREQTSASTEIAQRVELIAQGIEQTNAASAESSSRANVLVELSRALKEGVRRFRV